MGCNIEVKPLTISPIVPSSIAEAKDSISPHEHKKRPVPVITIDLIEGFPNKSSNISDINSIESRERAFLDASADKVTKATLFGKCSTVIVMIIGVGPYY
jgi:hypothetical protein